MIERSELEHRLIDLTRDLILIPSSVSRPYAIEQCMEMIHNHLEGIEGLDTQIYRKDNVPSLVARPAGVSNLRVILCAHCDVIDYADERVYRSKLEGNRIVGVGAGDMKGQLAILVELYRELMEKERYPVGLVVTSDEEVGGERGIPFLFNEVGINCEVMVIPDSGEMERITVAEKGILHLELRSQGVSGHASRTWVGENALEKLIRVVNRLLERFEKFASEKEDHWYPTLTPTMIFSPNRTPNRIPEEAWIRLDIRYTEEWSEERIEEIVSEELQKGMSMEKIVSSPPTHLNPDPLFKKVWEEVTGKKMKEVRSSGGSDARFVSERGISVIMTRPRVGNLHRIDEWIDIPSMVLFYEVLRKYLREKLNE